MRALIAQIRPGTGAGPAAPAERWYEAKFREAAKRVARGDYLGAVKLLDAILVVEPDCPIRDRLQALKIRAKELHLRTSVLEARLAPKKVLAAAGEAIELAIEIKNVSNVPLELALPDAPEGDVFGALEVETFEATPTGERTRSREVQRIATPIQARLAPGETWKTLVTLKPQPRPAGRDVFRRVTVSGSIRSQVLIRRDEKFDRFLPLFPVEIFVVDPAHHPIAAEPRQALADAIDALRKTHDEREAAALSRKVFFAALLTPLAEREPAIDALGATLDSDADPAAPAAISALAALCDRPADPNRATWRDWLRRRAN